MYCLNCEKDCSQFCDFDHLGGEYIECPSCNFKMTVEYDESWDEETNEEDSWWWFEKYED